HPNPVPRGRAGDIRGRSHRRSAAVPARAEPWPEEEIMNDFLRTILVLPEQRSTLAAEIDGLHYFVILVTMAGAVGVALFAAYYLVRYRRSAHRGGFRAPDPDRRHSPGGIPYWFEG